MAMTGMQLREQMISFLLANVDAAEREIAELQKQIAELKKTAEEKSIPQVQ